ncbi:hypothetical protein Acr_04g0002120 [Actinidia rufa]|uniref:Uncharacterized protein n=1 Tax=Actinidia rufa TaxID=165716 RepID=A0A7J0EG72_9ERIC|nr:hypothetical protein Acr_04g0002120 [Actinidia rufa]
MLPESQDCFQVTSGSDAHSQVKLVEGMNGEVGYDKFMPITFPFKGNGSGDSLWRKTSCGAELSRANIEFLEGPGEPKSSLILTGQVFGKVSGVIRLGLPSGRFSGGLKRISGGGKVKAKEISRPPPSIFLYRALVIPPSLGKGFGSAESLARCSGLCLGQSEMSLRVRIRRALEAGVNQLGELFLYALFGAYGAKGTLEHSRT